LKSRHSATRWSEIPKNKNMHFVFSTTGCILTISRPKVEKTDFVIAVFSNFALSGSTLSGLQSSR
jgi:hypothetical protein